MCIYIYIYIYIYISQSNEKRQSFIHDETKNIKKKKNDPTNFAPHSTELNHAKYCNLH